MTEKPRRKNRAVIAVLAVLLLAIIVPPFINANLFRARLARSVTGALGRNVTMGDVRIRLLPLPGFEIQNFVVADDPAFSAEPMLRAESVTARLRLTSLWRGRLEIARLSFSYPSLNLVRNAEGRWNIEGLLLHASQMPAAPTAKKQPEARPRFPYIEAESGRINFTMLQEKKAGVLLDADFALWQEAENQWNMRLEARPTRTDANLGDTGTLKVSGEFQRADQLDQTPIKLNVEWQKSQLGQLTTLIYGRDRGWRGDVTISGTLEGTPASFTAKASIRIDDFRRYDIASDDALRITSNCTANYGYRSPSGDSTSNMLECVVPFADGDLSLRSYGRPPWRSPAYVSLRLNHIPVSSLAEIFRRAKRGVPRDLTGEGTLNGYFSRVTVPANQPPRWIGQGAITNGRLSSQSLDLVFPADNIRFGFNQLELSPEGPASAGLTTRLKKSKALRTPQVAENILTIDPFPVALGGGKPMIIAGEVVRDGFQFQVKGDAGRKELSAAAQAFGLTLHLPLALTQGNVAVDLAVNDQWAGFAAPLVGGATRLLSPNASATVAESASNPQHGKTTRQH